jgi:hypothetical protein
MVAGGAAASSEAAGNIADKVSNTTGRGASTAKKFVTGGQSKLQPAIRGAAQTGADLGAARPSIELATADQHPVSVEFDADTTSSIPTVVNRRDWRRLSVKMEQTL